jgi:hypothetical protein
LFYYSHRSLAYWGSDTDLNCQRSENVLATGINYIHSFWDPRTLTNPLRPIIQKYYGYVMNTYIRKELEKRFSEMRQEKSSLRPASRSAKSVIALALEAYL